MGSLIFSNKLDTAAVDPAIQGRWQVVKIRNQDTGRLGKVPAKEPVMEILFSEGFASLEAGGNGISGEVNAADGQYQVVRYMTTTTKACEDQAKAQECRLYEAFSDGGFYQLHDGGLDILGKDKTLSISLVRTD